MSTKDELDKQRDSILEREVATKKALEKHAKKMRESIYYGNPPNTRKKLTFPINTENAEGTGYAKFSFYKDDVIAWYESTMNTNCILLLLRGNIQCPWDVRVSFEEFSKTMED